MKLQIHQELIYPSHTRIIIHTTSIYQSSRRLLSLLIELRTIPQKQFTRWNARPWWKAQLGKLHAHSGPCHKKIESLNFDTRSSPSWSSSSHSFFLFVMRHACWWQAIDSSISKYIFLKGRTVVADRHTLSGPTLAVWQQEVAHLALDRTLSCT